MYQSNCQLRTRFTNCPKLTQFLFPGARSLSQAKKQALPRPRNRYRPEPAVQHPQPDVGAVRRRLWRHLHSDCGQHKSSNWGPSFCGGDYSDGWKVSCSSEAPSEIQASNGQRFGNCYIPQNKNCVEVVLSAMYDFIHYCCQEIE